MNERVPKKLYPEDLPENFRLETIDVGNQMGLTRDVISKYTYVDGQQYWQAMSAKGIYYTINPKDPKILNYVDEANPKIRGNISFSDGRGGNPAGRPKGSQNRVSVKKVCEDLSANPAELLAAILKSDLQTLKRYGVKDPRQITVAQKLKVAELLLNKLVPNLKSADLDAAGEPAISKDIEAKTERSQLQVYVPTLQKTVSVEATEEELAEIASEGLEAFQEKHADEVTDGLAWELPSE